jgi:hypothetical protein
MSFNFIFIYSIIALSLMYLDTYLDIQIHIHGFLMDTISYPWSSWIVSGYVSREHWSRSSPDPINWSYSVELQR